MNEFRADLHCHSTFSDGSLHPRELIQCAKECGLSGLSITDHDTLAAYPEAFLHATKQGIKLLPGVEFSTMHKGHSIHVLAYSFLPQNPALLLFCEKHRLRRKARNLFILQRLKKIGMPLSEEELYKSDNQIRSIGRPHIAQEMVKKRYVNSIQEAFAKYLGEGCSCFEPGEAFSVKETLDAIHQAKGIAVIAHPHLIESYSIFTELMEMEFDGIEVYYGRFLANLVEPWKESAAKKGWIATGGSDFHGAFKPQISLGCSWAPQDSFEKLYAHFLEQCREE